MKRLGLMILAVGSVLFAQAAQADWTPAKRLTWTASISFRPAIAVDPSDNLHIVWYDFTPGNWEIFYKKSQDGGSSWTLSKRLTWNSSASAAPAIAVDSSGYLHMVWNDYASGEAEIYYKKSTDGGATWTPNKRLTWISGTSDYPAIAVDKSGNPHVVWQDDTSGKSEIFYGKSTDGGVTWLTSKRLTWTSGTSGDAAIAVDKSGNPHVVWQDDTPGNAELFYRKSTDGGATWLTSQRLTWTSGWSQSPSLAIDPFDNPHIVWYEITSGNSEIRYKKSTDGGTDWIAVQGLTSNSGYSYVPAIAVDSSADLHVVWYDNTPGNWEIYYKKGADAGAAWSAGQRLTWNSEASAVPVIAVDSAGHLHVVWQDHTPGNDEIYYKKGN